MGPSFRPQNRFGVSRLCESMRGDGFRLNEALTVWGVPGAGYWHVVSGNARLSGAAITSLQRVPCVVLSFSETEARTPTRADLRYAHGEAAKFEARGAPRSVISRMLELLSVLWQLEAKGVVLGTVGVEMVRDKMQSSKRERPEYFKHWSTGLADEYLRQHINSAKVIRAHGLQREVVELERLLENPGSVNVSTFISLCADLARWSS